MPGPTPTQRIEELRRDLGILSATVSKEHALLNQSGLTQEQKINTLEAQLQKLQERQQETLIKLASLEERTKALEKGTDRTWQFAPLIISGVAILVSTFVAFSKK